MGRKSDPRRVAQESPLSRRRVAAAAGKHRNKTYKVASKAHP